MQNWRRFVLAVLLSCGILTVDKALCTASSKTASPSRSRPSWFSNRANRTSTKTPTNSTTKSPRRQKSRNGEPTDDHGGDDLVYDRKPKQETPDDKSKPRKSGRGPFGLFKYPQHSKNETKSSINDKNADESSNHNATTAATTGTTTDTHSTNNSTTTNTTSTTVSETSTPANNTKTNTTPPTFWQPRMVVMGGPGPQSTGLMTTSGMPPGPMASPQAIKQASERALATAVLASTVSAASRLFIIFWIARKLAFEEETMSPVQHFVWESWNDRYSRDEGILENVLAQTPGGFSKKRWTKYLRTSRRNAKRRADHQRWQQEHAEDINATTALQVANNQKQPIRRTRNAPLVPTKTVIVVDITPRGSLDMEHLTDVMNFVVAAHHRHQFGDDPEIVLLVTSPGGPVTTYGLAAAQVGRLKQVGLNVTVCVDSIAASGGYMMASQAHTVIAAPFAFIGSIGVMAEMLNFNKVLNNYGVKPVILKSGDSKNPISTFGDISDRDLKSEQERMDTIHKAFIDLCLANRPSLDPDVCDGSVLVGLEALERGMIDRILTSDQYLYQRMREGAHILKLHKSANRPSKQIFFARALDLLPHLRERLRNLDSQKLVSAVVQAAAFWSMIERTLLR